MNRLTKTFFAFAALSALAWPASVSATAKYQESVLWSFGAVPDGEVPHSALILVNGKLYGTTSNGGINRGGAVFSVDPATGAETVLHSFCSPGCTGDGEEPA